jgi:hypothetical protein
MGHLPIRRMALVICLKFAIKEISRYALLIAISSCIHYPGLFRICALRRRDSPKDRGSDILHFHDPPHMPGTGEGPWELLSHAMPLAGTLGQTYVERRGVPVEVAEAAGVRFDADFGGRPAVLIAMRDQEDRLTSVHGRYLFTARGQNKMLTIGQGRGVVSLLGGWRVEPLLLVEGLFDALSLASCGWPSVATIGRWAPWLPEVLAGRLVMLAFDASRPGETEVARYASRLHMANVRRLPPPPRCKDWSTALVKRGHSSVRCWVGNYLEERETEQR